MVPMSSYRGWASVDNLGMKLVSAANIPKKERSSVTLRGMCLLDGLDLFVGRSKTMLWKAQPETEGAINTHFGNLTHRPNFSSYAPRR